MKRLKITLIFLVFSMLAFSQFGSHNVQYNSQDLISISCADSAVSDQRQNLTETTKIKQSFILRSNDVNAKLVKLERIFFSYWNTNTTSANLNIYEGDISSIGNLLHTQELTKEYIDPETGFQVPKASWPIKFIHLNKNLVLDLNKKYTFEIEVTDATDSYVGFYFLAADDYADGKSNIENKDFWFKMQGQIDSDTDTEILFLQDPSNDFYFDTYSHQFPEKLIGLFDSETIILKTSKVGNLNYLIEDESIAKIINTTKLESEEKVKILGLLPGNTTLFILNGADTISHIKLAIYKKKVLNISYQYFKFPGETEFKQVNACDDIMTTVQAIYDSCNVVINYTNQGIITYDWDLNGDNLSYDTKRLEMKSCQTLIKDTLKYFSNLYILRQHKDDSYIRGTNGSGTSFGFGSKVAPPRFALVRTHRDRTLSSLGSTLTHELGHNLGLVHYSSANSNYYDVPNEFLNLMKVGRTYNMLFGFQWDVVHSSIDYRASMGETYDNRLESNISGFDNMTQNSEGDSFSLNATANSGAEATYMITAGGSVVSINNNIVTPLAKGSANVKVFFAGTKTHKAVSKEVVITLSDLTSVEEFNKEMFIYPNPAKNSLTIKSSTIEIVEVKVMSEFGNLILQKEVNGLNEELNLIAFPAGLYILQIRTSEGIINRKFIKM